MFLMVLRSFQKENEAHIIQNKQQISESATNTMKITKDNSSMTTNKPLEN